MATAPSVQRVRLNLLPPEIPAARRARATVPFAIVVILVAVVGTLLWVNVWESAKKKYDQKLQEAQNAAKDVDDLQQAIDTEKNKVQPIKDMVHFYDQFETQASRYADVAEAISHYLPAHCAIQSLSISDSTVNFATQVEDTEALVRLLTNVNRCAMPQYGGGTEPVWSEDAVSRGPLKRLFSGPIQFTASLGGMTMAAPVYEGQDPTQAISFAQITPGGQMPTVGTGAVTYQNGLIWEGPIPVTITGTLAEPITLWMPAAGAAPGGAEAGAGPMAGGSTPPAGGGAAAGGTAAGGDTGGDTGDDTGGGGLGRVKRGG